MMSKVPDLGSPDAWKLRFCQLSSIILHKMLTTASKHSEHFAALRQRSTEQCIVTVSFAPRLVGSAAPPSAMKRFIVVPSGKSRDFRGEGRPMGIVPATCLHVIPRAPGCSFPWCSWMSFKRHHWRRLRLRYPQLVEPSLSPRSDGLAHRNVCQKKKIPTNTIILKKRCRTGIYVCKLLHSLTYANELAACNTSWATHDTRTGKEEAEQS